MWWICKFEFLLKYGCTYINFFENDYDFESKRNSYFDCVENKDSGEIVTYISIYYMFIYKKRINYNFYSYWYDIMRHHYKVG